ncbi:hypothetical protein MAR_010801 [Mya arenaria]|uniref:Uncharacterized protein n=1 Tax=Mya arenaria TaxID=6604 RepID=A0ABY7FU07_MYAAR|nr:hypothetical protein MAR_010801 [Mya arenaria]
MVPNEELVMLFGVVMIASVVGRDVHNFYGNRFSTTESDSIINRMVSLQKRSQRGRIDRHRFFHFGLGKRADQERALIDGFVSAGNRIVRKSSLYKTLQMYNDETNKRDPEMFSEELYPLQAGKQKLEAYLDSALKDSEETTDAIMESAVQTEDTNEEIADQNNDNNNNVKQLDERPFDLTFASPDLDFGRYGYNKGQMQDDVAVVKVAIR